MITIIFIITIIVTFSFSLPSLFASLLFPLEPSFEPFDSFVGLVLEPPWTADHVLISILLCYIACYVPARPWAVAHSTWEGCTPPDQSWQGPGCTLTPSNPERWLLKKTGWKNCPKTGWKNAQKKCGKNLSSVSVACDGWGGWRIGRRAWTAAEKKDIEIFFKISHSVTGKMEKYLSMSEKNQNWKYLVGPGVLGPGHPGKTPGERSEKCCKKI